MNDTVHARVKQRCAGWREELFSWTWSAFLGDEQGDIPHVGPDASTLVRLPYEGKHIVHTLDGDLVMPRDLIRMEDQARWWQWRWCSSKKVAHRRDEVWRLGVPRISSPSFHEKLQIATVRRRQHTANCSISHDAPCLYLACWPGPVGKVHAARINTNWKWTANNPTPL